MSSTDELLTLLRSLTEAGELVPVDEIVHVDLPNDAEGQGGVWAEVDPINLHIVCRAYADLAMGQKIRSSMAGTNELAMTVGPINHCLDAFACFDLSGCSISSITGFLR